MMIKNVFKWKILNRRILPILIVFSCFLGTVYLYLVSHFHPNFENTFIDGDQVPFLIDTAGYKLPDFDPFHKTVERYIVPPPDFSCNKKKRPLTTAHSDYIDNEDVQKLKSLLKESKYECVIIKHEDRLLDYSITSADCSYRSIEKSDDTDDYRLGDWYLIEAKITRIRSTSVLVECSSDGYVFYKNVHNFVQQTYGNKSSSKTSEDKSLGRYNVLILGIDSISRLNMRRYMPITREYLHSLNAIELKGFNRHGDNTFPNLLSLLTGMSEIESLAYVNESKYYDEVPFIWDRFARNGYATFSAEDCTTFQLFNYWGRKGFHKLPTDGYLRPSFLVAEEAIGWDFMLCNKCLGERSTHQVLLDYAEDISIVLRDSKYFSFIWSTTLTHDLIERSGVVDDPTAQFLKKMKGGGYWNDTVVFFLSDHGMRFGNIRNTYMGRFEESLPFAYVILPDKFEMKYPKAYQNILDNRLKLTTHFDIFQTLKAISEPETIERDVGSSGEQSKYSLFQEIPTNRTCLSSNIPIKYCGSVKLVKQEVESPLIREIGEYIVDSLRQLLQPFPQCVRFNDFTITSGGQIIVYGENDKTLNHTRYEIKLITYPGEAQVEALVKVTFNDLTNGYSFSLDIDDISRTNSYKGQSECVYDELPERFCYCSYLL